MGTAVAEETRTIWVFVDDPAMNAQRLKRWREQPRHRVVFLDRNARRMLTRLPAPDVVVFGMHHVRRREPWLERCRVAGTFRILISSESPRPGLCDHHVPVERPQRLCGHLRFVHG